MMSDFKPRPGSFLPYLEAKQQLEEEQRAKASPLTLLDILARRPRQELPIFDLQAQSGMEPKRYGDALKSLRDAGFIAIEGEGPDQTVRLTDAGAGVVRLAKPA
jgi:predicted transcriptional regulator